MSSKADNTYNEPKPKYNPYFPPGWSIEAYISMQCGSSTPVTSKKKNSFITQLPTIYEEDSIYTKN
jgi:hypothetical protein